MNNWQSHVYWLGPDVKDILNALLGNSPKPVRLILGEGFDPRMLDCLALLTNIQGCQVNVSVLKIGRSKVVEQADLERRAELNLSNLQNMLPAGSNLDFVDTQFEEEDRNSTAPAASDKSVAFARGIDLTSIGSLVVDISALPQGLYFPLLETLIGQRREEFLESNTSLYVFVSENAGLDSKISGLELQEDAYMVPPFRSALSVSEDDRPIIWFPVLGEGESEQLQRIEKLLPARVEREICPILPMPSANPRRADLLIREYESNLQDSWAIDSRSFIYSDERNPFHLYMQLSRAALRYKDALSVIGGCRAVVSCHSSKLLSLGALLACSELNEMESDDFAISIANVDATAYSFSSDNDEDISPSTHFFIPILGEVFED